MLIHKPSNPCALSTSVTNSFHYWCSSLQNFGGQNCTTFFPSWRVGVETLLVEKSTNNERNLWLFITLLIHVHSPLQSQIPFIIGALLYKKSLDSHSSWRAKSCTILAPKIFDAFHMKKIWYFLAPNFAAQLWPNWSNTDGYFFTFSFLSIKGFGLFKREHAWIMSHFEEKGV